MIRDIAIKHFSTVIEPTVAKAIVTSYELLLAKYRSNDIEGSLSVAGLFVEHVLRAIEFIRNGVAPAEIKSVSVAVKEIEKDTNLSDSLRFLIPRIAYGMIYEVRSKRGAVHVKEIDPKHIDASLAVSAASWVMAELLRLYHSSDEAAVAAAMDAFMRGHIPYVETFGDEHVVTQRVPCNVEVLLLILRSGNGKLDRRAIGKSSKYSAPRVTEAIQKLLNDRLLHQTSDGKFHVTGPGERLVANQLAIDGVTTLPGNNRAS